MNADRECVIVAKDGRIFVAELWCARPKLVGETVPADLSARGRRTRVPFDCVSLKPLILLESSSSGRWSFDYPVGWNQVAGKR